MSRCVPKLMTAVIAVCPRRSGWQAGWLPGLSWMMGVCGSRSVVEHPWIFYVSLSSGMDKKERDKSHGRESWSAQSHMGEQVCNEIKPLKIKNILRRKIKSPFFTCPMLANLLHIFYTSHQSVTRPFNRVTPKGNWEEYTEFRFVEYWSCFLVNHGCLFLCSEELEQWVRQRSDCMAYGRKRVELLYFVNWSAQIEMPTLAEN